MKLYITSVLLPKDLTQNNEQYAKKFLTDKSNPSTDDTASWSKYEEESYNLYPLSIALHPVSCRWTYDFDNSISIQRIEGEKIEYGETYVYCGE